MNHLTRVAIDRVQQAGGPHHVSIEIVLKSIEAAADRDLCGEMKDTIDLAQRFSHHGFIPNVAMDETCAVGDGVAPADGEIVEHGDTPAFRQ